MSKTDCRLCGLEDVPIERLQVMRIPRAPNPRYIGTISVCEKCMRELRSEVREDVRVTPFDLE